MKHLSYILLLLTACSAPPPIQPLGVTAGQYATKSIQCFTYVPPLLFDTTHSGAGVPDIPRAIGLQSTYWFGSTILYANIGNNLGRWKILSDGAFSTMSSSEFNVPVPADRDQALRGWSVCNDCRYGVACFEEYGTVVFDLGQYVGYPSFRNHTLYANAGNVGAYTFWHFGIQYVVARDLTPACPYQTALYRINDTTNIETMHCMGPLVIYGGLKTRQYHYIIDGANNIHVMYMDENLQLVDMGVKAIGSAAVGANAGHGVAIENDLMATGVNGTIRLYDVSDPANPSFITSWVPTPGRAYQTVALGNDLLYVSEPGVGDVLVYDVFVPTQPRLLPSNLNATFPHSDRRDAVFTHGGNWLYVAGFSTIEHFHTSRACANVDGIFSDNFETGTTINWSYTSAN